MQNSCKFPLDKDENTVFSLENLGPQEAPAATEGSGSSGFTLSLLGTTLSNLTSQINRTTWTVSDIEFSADGHAPLIIIEVLKRAAFNLSASINPETLEILLEGRFFEPRRGPSVRATGYINMSEEVPVFTAAGEFNYPFFAPSIPREDPNEVPELPEEDDDYDYDDDHAAKPPTTDRGPVSPEPIKSPEPESSGVYVTYKAWSLLLISHFIV